MVCDTIHELYFPPIGKKPKGAPLRKASASQDGANIGSVGTNQPRQLQSQNINERYESVHGACLSASEKLREALQSQIALSEPLPSSRGTLSIWITSEEENALSARPKSSSARLQGRSHSKRSEQRPKSQQSRRMMTGNEPGRPIVIRDNTVCANEWISECSPKVWLLDAEKEVWVQHREAERRRWQTYREALNKMKKRAVPFDIWLAQCKHAEHIADERNLVEEKIEQVEAKVKEKKSYDYLLQGEDTSHVTLQTVQKMFMDMGKTDWQRCFHRLAEEYAGGRCELAYSANRQVERIVHVAALWLESCDGSILVQLGIWCMGRLTPTCRLPAMKQTLDQSPEDAIMQLLKQEFVPFGVDPRLGTSQTQTHWNDSPQFGVRTKYVRTVVTAKLDASLEAISCVKALRKPSLQNDPTSGQRASALKNDTRPIVVAPLQSQKSRIPRRSTPRYANQIASKAPEMYMLWHGTDIQLCAWVSPEEFDHLRGPVGERQLKLWLSSVTVDPTIMPPRHHYVR